MLRLHRPIFVAIVLLTAVFLNLQNASPTFAQEEPPEIDSFSTAQTPIENEPITITILGEGFNEQNIVYFRNLETEDRFELEIVSVSDSEIIAQFQVGLAIGNYRICIDLECSERTIEVNSPLNTEIVGFAPKEFYQFVESQTLIITGTDFYAQPVVTIADQEIDRAKNWNNSTVTATFPTHILNPGTYDITIEFPNKEPFLLDDAITILEAINPTIEKIEPITVFRLEPIVVFTITGQNLSQFSRINFNSTYNCEATSPLCLPSIDNQQIVFSIYSASFPTLFSSAKSITDWTVNFPDGSAVSIPQITVIERSMPWDEISWLIAIGLILISSAWVTASYHRASKTVFDTYKQDKRVPSMKSIMRLLFDSKNLDYSKLRASFRLLVRYFLLFVLFFLSFVINILESSLHFTWVVFLVSLNIGSIFVLTRLNGKFYRVVPTFIRLGFALIALAITLLVPVFTTEALRTDLTALFELLTLASIWIIGTVGLRFAQVQLARERDKVTDEQVDVSVEQILFQTGQIQAEVDLPELPRDQVVRAMSRYFATHRETQDILFSEPEGSLSFIRGSAIENIHHAFASWQGNLEDKEQTTTFVEQFSKVLGFENDTSQENLVETPSGFCVFNLTSHDLESVLPTPFPLITFGSSKAMSSAQEKDFEALLNKMHLPSRFAIVVAATNPEITRGIIRKELVEGVAGQNIVVLGQQDCKNILASKDEIRLAFMRTIQEQVDLTIFSPYRTEMPTPQDMFYGRRQEIKRVLEQITESSVAVLGARRIGKTSLLQMVQKVLVDRGNLLLYLDCYDVNDYDQFFSNISASWDFVDLNTKYNSLSGFRHLVNDLQKQYPNRQIIFQFDEIDRLLAFDFAPEQDENLFRMFRSLAQEKKAQFIFSGERTILQQLANPKSAFYNFPTSVPLGLLDQETTEKLIIEPMELVGVHFENRQQAVETVFDYTYGHPNLIQFLCNEILSKLSRTKFRSITIDLILETCSSTTYRDKFVETFWSQAMPIEKAISGCISELGQASQAEIIEHVKNVGFEPTIHELQDGLRYLELSQLVIAENGRYQIRPQKFSEHLIILGYQQWYKQWRYDHERQLLSS